MSAEELTVLTDYAQEKGRRWKAALHADWIGARRPGILQALRNDPAFGPAGLDAFHFLPTRHTVQADLTQLPGPIAAPVYQDGKGAGKLLNNDGNAFLWSGIFPIPAVGDSVVVTLGRGEVIGYFTEGGWLGLMVELEAPSKRLREQNPDNPALIYVFGIEVEG